MRVTKLTDYGIALMACLANGDSAEQATAQDLAEAMNLPLPTVRKILKTLARDGLLESTRGAGGGYRLAREPEKISLLDMVSAIEGPVAMTECASGKNCGCAQKKTCEVKDNWSEVNDLFKEALEGYSLARMAADPSQKIN